MSGTFRQAHPVDCLSAGAAKDNPPPSKGGRHLASSGQRHAGTNCKHLVRQGTPEERTQRAQDKMDTWTARCLAGDAPAEQGTSSLPEAPFSEKNAPADTALSSIRGKTASPVKRRYGKRGTRTVCGKSARHAEHCPRRPCGSLPGATKERNGKAQQSPSKKRTTSLRHDPGNDKHPARSYDEPRHCQKRALPFSGKAALRHGPLFDTGKNGIASGVTVGPSDRFPARKMTAGGSTPP